MVKIKMISMMETGCMVGDAMSPFPACVGPEINLQDCAKKMAEKKIGSLLVKDDGKLLGIFTEQDMVRKAMMNNRLAAEVKAKEIMEKIVVTIAPDQDITQAIELMRDNNVRHLPVINEERVVGLITLKDILKIQPELFEIVSEKMVLGKEKDLLRE